MCVRMCVYIYYIIYRYIRVHIRIHIYMYRSINYFLTTNLKGLLSIFSVKNNNLINYYPCSL